LCKLCANNFCALHTREQTQCKLYFCFTARPRLRLPRTPLRCARHGEGLHSATAGLSTAGPAAASRGTVTAPLPARGDGGRHRTGAKAGQAAQARGAVGPGRRQPASARGDDTTGSPGRRLSVRTVIVRTTAAASAGARGTPSRTLPQARAVNNMHAHNLNATARFHCSHPAWKDEIITPLPPSLLLPYFFPPSPSLNPVADRAARFSRRAESYAQSRTCGLMEQCHGSAPRRAAAHYDWRARMWRPRRRLHMDGGHNRALACTWMRHGSLESGCSHACTPRRRTHPNFNSQHFFLVHAALESEERVRARRV
jgi:hypothetical protein